MIIVASHLDNSSRGEDQLVVEHCDGGLLAVIADGAGGMGGGHVASRTFCHKVMETFRSQYLESAGWDKRLAFLDGVVAEMAQGGCTTGLVAEIVNHQIVGASVGDSEAWLISPEGLLDLTGNQVRKPLLGSGVAEAVAFGPIRMRGRLLLGSDGLFKYGLAADIANIALEKNIDVAVSSLVELVRMKNGMLQDDLSIILCEEVG